MRLIKPGKIGLNFRDSKVARPTDKEPPKEREIWDDYTSLKPTNKKREYELGSGNRMVPKATPKHDKHTSEEGDEGHEHNGRPDRPQPRSDYDTIEQKLGFVFKDRSHLARALTHRSALGLKERADYERLEFLGDAVLDLSIAHLLSDLHPDAREGELSKMRAALVNTQALAQIAKSLDFGPFIKLGRGELSSGGSERPSILADVMEAVIGAVYRDSSYDEALKLIERIFGTALEQVTPFDPKTELQEALHAAGSEPPTYLLELVEGPEHAPTFVTVVVIDGEVVGRGRGPTKKAAQQAAAAQALERLGSDVPPVELADNQQSIIAGAIMKLEKIEGSHAISGIGETAPIDALSTGA
ncbi:MAG: ribonuclease III [Bdellovibrionota bacterium]